jgi:hypothetical protein
VRFRAPLFISHTLPPAYTPQPASSLQLGAVVYVVGQGQQHQRVAS